MGVCTVVLCSCIRAENVRPDHDGPSDCQRCHMDGPSVYRVKTRDMELMVCERCATDAVELGMPVGSFMFKTVSTSPPR